MQIVLGQLPMQSCVRMPKDIAEGILEFSCLPKLGSTYLNGSLQERTVLIVKIID
jgi:hypothetical protein